MSSNNNNNYAYSSQSSSRRSTSAADPFASTSQMLGRASERRAARRQPVEPTEFTIYPSPASAPPPQQTMTANYNNNKSRSSSYHSNNTDDVDREDGDEEEDSGFHHRDVRRQQPPQPPRDYEDEEPGPTRMRNPSDRSRPPAPPSSRYSEIQVQMPPPPVSATSMRTSSSSMISAGSGASPSSGRYRGSALESMTSTTLSMAYGSGNTGSGAGGGGGDRIFDFVPPEYLYNPTGTDPVLHFLPKLMETKNATDPSYVLNLTTLLKAADEDVRLHRARVKAGLEQDHRWIRSYQWDQDPVVQQRQERLQARRDQVQELSQQALVIRQALSETTQARGLTQAERTRLLLQHWQHALELYVLAPPTTSISTTTTTLTSSTTTTALTAPLDWQSLLEQLLDGVAEDQDISQVLSEAAQMCANLVDTTRQAVLDASDQVGDMESAFVIRLEAHQLYARTCLMQVHEIEEQFKTSGRSALQIGHQLQHADSKRSQCEAAAILIRRWWIMENLAEQEAASGHPLDVVGEMNGQVSVTTRKMDPLFTDPENSLEASKALKQLRAVVRSRGNAAATAGAGPGGGGSMMIMGDLKASARRFDLTANLITRTSDALELRLLNSFAKVYGSSGALYDFSPKPRPGAIDWRELRSLAQSLLLFDSGRNLHKRYVDMVITLRFPELFHRAPETNKPRPARRGDGDNKDRNDDEEDDPDEQKRREEVVDDEFDMDATRSKLSNLFHRISEVCTSEFQLIAHVFGSEGSRTDLLDGHEEMPLVVTRALLQRVISDPENGLQSRINDLLSSIDRHGDFDSGAKKLDTFVVIHEKAAGLFSLLKEAAERMVPESVGTDPLQTASWSAAKSAVESLKGFLTSQELALSNTHRQGYINLEMRLLHHNCCTSLDQAGCALVKGPPPRLDPSLAEKGILEEYRAPVLPLHLESLQKGGFTGILAGPLKQSVLRQPLIHATDSLARARLMFGTSKRRGETTSRVILKIYSQMCSFYGEGFLYPIIEALRDMLPTSPPSQPPQLPFDEEQDAPDLGVSPAFWVSLERLHSAAKSFDRELWAEGRTGSQRVWDTLQECGDTASIAIAREERLHFFSELERKGEATILRALDALSTHIQWVLVTGGESMLATGGTRILSQLTGQSGGPYAVPTGASLETPNSPAVKSLTYCLRVQFVHVQAALTAQSLSSFWTALSMRLYDILVTRLLQHYSISTVGAVILSRDVEALRSVAMLAGSNHSHWDAFRELLTLYMTPPDAIKTMLIGPEGESSKGLFSKMGRETCLVFLSRRNDYRYKTTSGMKKSGWVTEMLGELNTPDPTDGAVNIGLYSAGRMNQPQI